MISIHSSHTGRDRLRKDCSRFRIFQSTLPIREETENYGALWNEEPISIHSSHTGRDAEAMNTTLVDDFNPLFPYGKRRKHYPEQRRRDNFNPLFPYGKRPWVCAWLTSCWVFQSTLPIREETLPEHRRRWPAAISIHSSHTGRDSQLRLVQKICVGFQSTLPTRGETDKTPTLRPDL